MYSQRIPVNEENFVAKVIELGARSMPLNSQFLTVGVPT
jgi:hypothetical protein